LDCASCRKIVNVPSGQSTDDPGSCDGGVADGNDILEFGFENTVAPLSILFSRRICSARSHSMSPYYVNPRRPIELCAPVKVLARADRDDRIRVGECSEDTDFVGVFKLSADSHDG
jgi:hypothetical protein